ncbi:unnamed protein product [Caenorhabditis auriculariae]|uniref:Uncharacterized protein n=1 Tax=Caenorhabditis auriculariae TaxID=2777116 RepID=A0A8S1GXT2_9PELO|nr:unnamed protein product [Caenorhabditis auriculariae]
MNRRSFCDWPQAIRKTGRRESLRDVVNAYKNGSSEAEDVGKDEDVIIQIYSVHRKCLPNDCTRPVRAVQKNFETVMWWNKWLNGMRRKTMGRSYKENPGHMAI